MNDNKRKEMAINDLLWKIMQLLFTSPPITPLLNVQKRHPQQMFSFFDKLNAFIQVGVNTTINTEINGIASYGPYLSPILDMKSIHNNMIQLYLVRLDGLEIPQCHNRWVNQTLKPWHSNVMRSTHSQRLPQPLTVSSRQNNMGLIEIVLYVIYRIVFYFRDWTFKGGRFSGLYDLSSKCPFSNGTLIPREEFREEFPHCSSTDDDSVHIFGQNSKGQLFLASIQRNSKG